MFEALICNNSFQPNANAEMKKV